MAVIGISNMIFAEIDDDNNGGMPTYKPGTEVDKAISADISWTRSNNPLYANNGVAEADNEITGYSLAAGLRTMPMELTEAMLGSRKETTDEVEEYIITGSAGKPGGFGYLTMEQTDNVVSVVGNWVYKIVFSRGDVSIQTKGEQKTYQTPTIQGTGMGIETGHEYPDYGTQAKFTTKAAALAWLRKKAGNAPAT